MECIKKVKKKMVQYTTSIKHSSNVVKPFTAQQSKELSCIHLTHQLQLFICLRGQKQIENKDYNSNTQALFYTWFLSRMIWSHHFWSDFEETLWLHILLTSVWYCILMYVQEVKKKKKKWGNSSNILFYILNYY